MARQRCILFSYHLFKKAKISCIIRLSQRYNVNGIFKTGKPCYIFLDGNTEEVREALTVVKVSPSTEILKKGLHWRLIRILRTEKYHGKDEDAPLRSMERVEEMGELRDSFRERALLSFIKRR